MKAFWFRIRQWLHFYSRAVTKYQLHSPFVFDLANAVLEDDRWYYAFRDVEAVRNQMLTSDAQLEVVDYGAGHSGSRTGKITVRKVARDAASSRRQGQMLFRLADWARPRKVLELGGSLGIGTMYLAAAVRSARVVSLEGCPDYAKVARINLDLLDLKNVSVLIGEFDHTLPKALETLQKPGLVFIDGNHRPEPTLRYFEACLASAGPDTVFVFDDIYWSPGMLQAWKKIQEHPRVTLTVDMFDLSLAFINPDLREKQHFSVVPVSWKPWKVW